MIISLSLIGMQQEAQAQVVTSNTTGDPFTIGEGNSTLSLYSFASDPVDGGSENIIPLQPQTLGSHAVDPISERLVLNFTSTQNLQHLLIDLDTTLGELQQTINQGGDMFMFNYNFTELTTDDYNIELSIAVFDDEVITEQNMLGAGSVTDIIIGDNPQGSILDSLRFFPLLTNSTNADKSIGYRIWFYNPVTVNSGEYPISIDINSLESDGTTPISQITRTWTYPLEPEPPGLTQERLAALIEVRNLALDQQNLQIDYWSNSTNPFADNRTMAQDRLNNANYHISITTAQRDSYQTELDGLTG